MRFIRPSAKRHFKLTFLFAALHILILTPCAYAQTMFQAGLSPDAVEALDAATAQFRSGGSASSVEIALPSVNGILTAHIRPFDIRTADYRSEVTGPSGLRPDSARVDLFTGTPNSKGHGDFIRLTLERNIAGATVVLGFYQADGEMYAINPSSGHGLNFAVEQLSKEAIAKLLAHCGVSAELIEPNSSDSPRVSALREVEIGTEADYPYFQEKGSNQNSTNAYILSILSAVSAIYETQVGAMFRVTYQHVWTTSNDPYTSSDPGTLLTQFQNFWNSNVAPFNRYDVAHLFTATDLTDSVVGLAYLNALCTTSRYGLSQTLESASLDTIVVAHELGHNFGSDHDGCTSGERFIMCPSLVSGATQFSTASLNAMSALVSNRASCLPLLNQPVLNPIGAKSTSEYSTLTIPLSGSDPEGDTIVYSFSPAQPGMSLSGSTFTYSPVGNVVTNGASSAEVTVTFTVTDSSGLTDNETIIITVASNNLPPVLNEPGTQSIPEGTVAAITVQGTDPDGDALTYAVVSGLPPGASFTNGILRFRPGGDQAGTHSIVFRGTDTYNASDTATLTLNITDTPGVPALPIRHARPDFNGDGLADVALFRYRTGEWFSAKMFPGAGDVYTYKQWGLPGDVAVPGDYNGDRITDYAVYRPSSATWFITMSGTDIQSGNGFGVAGDIPAPGDFDGDGRWDPAVYRPSTGTFFYSSSVDGSTVTIANLGAAGDVPVPCDYDGDSKFDPAVFRPTTGVWTVVNSTTGTPLSTTLGTLGDLPVPGDYEGSAACERAVWRPSDGTWYVAGNAGVQWGLGEDVPAPADYNGDGKLDFEVFRPNFATWYYRSGDGSGSVTQLGLYYDLVATHEALTYALRNSSASAAAALSTDPRTAWIFERSSQQLVRAGAAGNTAATVSANTGSYILQGDYDGDGTNDAASFGGNLFIIYQSFAGVRAAFWGVPTDVPVSGDFDGDGKTDIAVFRPDAGGGFSAWYVIRSSDGGVTTYNWGITGDIPVPADFDGDGVTDPAVWREALGYWFVMGGRSGQQIQATQWGLPGDVPRVADFDGDGRADKLVYRPANGMWFLFPSAGGPQTGTQWGIPGDIALPGRYLSSTAVDYAVYRASTRSIYVRSQAGVMATLGTGLTTSAQAVAFVPPTPLR